MARRPFLPLLRDSSPQDLERLLSEWFSSPLGGRLLAEQTNILTAVMPRLFGYYCLHAGPISLPELRQASTIKRHFRLASSPEQYDNQLSNKDSVCVGSLGALPFDTNSVDAVVLHHSLDIEQDPHGVLRETCRVLLPGGTIVIVGFNPWSLWGLWRMMTFRTAFGSHQAPWGCRFVSPYRLSDWLNLLDFEVEGCETRFFSPLPLQRRSKHPDQWMRFVEKHFRAFGASYVLVAKKREVCVTPLKSSWQRKASIKPVVVAHAREPSVSVVSLLEARRRRDSSQDT